MAVSFIFNIEHMTLGKNTVEEGDEEKNAIEGDEEKNAVE